MKIGESVKVLANIRIIPVKLVGEDQRINFDIVVHDIEEHRRLCEVKVLLHMRCMLPRWRLE